MKDFARRKQYVEVVATHYIDGSVRPQKIILATGPVYEIEDCCWRREIATIFCREYLTNFCRR